VSPKLRGAIATHARIDLPSARRSAFDEAGLQV